MKRRSPDGAERNPGLPRGVDAAPDFAPLHPGYACSLLLLATYARNRTHAVCATRRVLKKFVFKVEATAMRASLKRHLHVALGIAFFSGTFHLQQAFSSQAAREACLSVLQETWTVVEKRAWQSICRDTMVDFTQSSEQDSTELTERFLTTIVSNSEFTQFLPDKRLVLQGVTIQKWDINLLNLDYLLISKSRIGHISIAPIHLGNLFIADSQINNGILVGGNLDNLDLLNVRAGDIYLYRANIKETANLHITHADQVRIKSIIGGNLTISGEIDSVDIEGTSVGGNLLSLGPRSRVSIDDSVVASTLTLVNTWNDGASLRVADLKANRLELPNDVPELSLQSLEFNQWGRPLTPTLDLLRRNKTYSPTLYSKLTKIFKDLGDYSGATQLQYQSMNAKYDHSSWIDRILLTISWASVGYGLYPEVGFIWFALLIVCAYYVFASGESLLLSGSLPRSWFVYAMDAVIPVIKLDPEHDKIGFKGWRQYFLYLMKILSAVLAFLVFRVLQDAFRQ
jgi:hypothetical protein